MAYVIPLRTPPGSPRGPQVLMIILTKDNLDRMREGDPFDLQTRAYSSVLDQRESIGNLDIVVAYEEDGQRLEELAAADDIAGILKYLERGRKHRPGDTAPPLSIRKRP